MVSFDGRRGRIGLALGALVALVALAAWLYGREGASVRNAATNGGGSSPVVPAASAAGPVARAVDAPTPGSATPAGTASADPGVGVEVHGFVLGPDGLPRAKARVVSPQTGRVVTEADDNGEFVLRVGERPALIQARAGKLQSEPRVIRADAAESVVILQLAALTELVVHVASAIDYSSIQGAEVWASDTAAKPASTVRTDAQGKARVPLPNHGGVIVAAEAEGWGRASRRIQTSGLSGGVQSTRLELLPAAVVRGRVTWADHRPALGARVSARDADTGVPVDVAEVDRDGSFALEHLYAGSFAFEAQLAGAAQLERLERIGAGGSTLDFVLGGAGALTGWVKGSDGRAAAGASVDALLGSEKGFLQPRRRQVQTDDAGRFALTGVDRVDVQLTASRGHERSAVVSVTAGQRGPVELQLEAGGRIAGSVRDRAGRPVPGAEVLAISKASTAGPSAQQSSTRSGAEGRFELDGLSPGTWALHARGPEDLLSSGADGPGTLATVGATNVELVVEATGTIEGQVQFEDGSQPEEVTVLLSGHAVPNVAGASLVLRGVPEGSYDLLLTGPEFEPAVVSDVAVRAGAITGLDAIEVRRGRILFGTVTDGRGAPVASAKVVAGRSIHAGERSLTERSAGAEPESRSTQTDEKGSFQLSGVVAGKVAVLAEHPRFGRSAVTYVEPGASEPLELVLVTPTQLEGRVSDGETPLEGVAVIAESGKMVKHKGVTDASGHYQIAGLAPGEYQVTAARPTASRGFDLMKHSVTVSEGRPSTLNFEFGVQSVRVTVQATQAKSVLLRGSSVYLEENPGENGFEFPSVVPGNYSLCLLTPDSAAKTHCQPHVIAAEPAHQIIRP